MPRADNLTTFMCQPSRHSWSPMGLSRPVQGQLYLYTRWVSPVLCYIYLSYMHRKSQLYFLNTLNPLNSNLNYTVSSHRAVNTSRLGYKKNKSVNTVQETNSCLFWDPHKANIFILWAERRIFEC